MTTPFRRLMTLGRDNRAATAVEFAMLVTPLFLLILASLQLSLILYAGQVLQSGAMWASRTLMTGTAQQAGITASAYKTQYVCQNGTQNITFLFNCNNVLVDVQSSSSYTGIVTPITLTYDAQGNVSNAGTLKYAPGNPGDVIILRVMYNWPVVASPLLPGLANQTNGTHLLVATSVFKTEPY